MCNSANWGPKSYCLFASARSLRLRVFLAFNFLAEERFCRPATLLSLGGQFEEELSQDALGSWSGL